MRRPQLKLEAGTTVPSQPYTDPERLETFAVKTGDGTIIEGRTAHDARMRSARSGLDCDFYGEGFITSRGRFVPEGRAALMLAFRADQLRRNTSLYKSLSQGVTPLEVRDYGNESSVRGVGGKNATVGPAPEPIIAARITESGVERRPDTNPYHEVYLREQERNAGLPPDLHNPEGGPVIRSRALKFGEKGAERIDPTEQFSDNGQYVDRDTGQPSAPLTEGYLLSDGSFITRDEARSMFASADIGPEGRGANARKPTKVRKL